jgi:hypothetical protein
LCKEPAKFRLSASVVSPVECRRIVGYVEENRVRGVCYVLCCEHVHECAVDYDDPDEFYDVY